MIVRLKTFKSGCGDCIFFTLEGAEGRFSVMVDCGAYSPEIKAFITDDLDNHIDLLVVTHIDADHILGVRDMLEEMPELEIGELWFNAYSRVKENEIPLSEKEKKILERLYASRPVVMDVINAKVSAKQAVTLSEAILNHTNAKKAWHRERITTNRPEYNIHDGKYGKLTIISPRVKELNVIDEKFRSLFYEFFHKEHPDTPLEKDDSLFEMLQLLANEQEQIELIESEKSAFQMIDDSFLIEATNHKVLKSSDANEASIAFIWELEGHRILFTGDAAPKIMEEALKEHYGEVVTQFDAVKISHHGSAHGTSKKMMSLIDSPHFFFTGGEEDIRPHIDAIARVITRPMKDGLEQRVLHFNYENNWTDELKKAVNLQDNYHYTIDTDSNELRYEF